MSARDNWQHYRRGAGFETYMLAGLLFILPKIGPLRLVAVKGPTPATDAEYMHSVALSVAALRMRLARFTPPSARRLRAAGNSAGTMAEGAQAAQSIAQQLSPGRRHPLPNLDLDTGHPVRSGGYPLTDSTYARLLHRLTRHPSRPIPPGIKSNIEAYYANPNAPITTKKHPKEWARVQADLAILATMPTSTSPEPYPTYSIDAAAESQ